MDVYACYLQMSHSPFPPRPPCLIALLLRKEGSFDTFSRAFIWVSGYNEKKNRRSNNFVIPSNFDHLFSNDSLLTVFLTCMLLLLLLYISLAGRVINFPFSRVYLYISNNTKCILLRVHLYDTIRGSDMIYFCITYKVYDDAFAMHANCSLELLSLFSRKLLS